MGVVTAIKMKSTITISDYLSEPGSNTTTHSDVCRLQGLGILYHKAANGLDLGLAPCERLCATRVEGVTNMLDNDGDVLKMMRRSSTLDEHYIYLGWGVCDVVGHERVV